MDQWGWRFGYPQEPTGIVVANDDPPELSPLQHESPFHYLTYLTYPTSLTWAAHRLVHSPLSTAGRGCMTGVAAS